MAGKKRGPARGSRARPVSSTNGHPNTPPMPEEIDIDTVGAAENAPGKTIEGEDDASAEVPPAPKKRRKKRLSVSPSLIVTEPRVRSGEHVVRDLGWESRSREERQAEAALRRAGEEKERRQKQAVLDERARRYEEGVDLLAQLAQERQDELEAEEANFARGMSAASGGRDAGEDDAMDVVVDENSTPKARKSESRRTQLVGYACSETDDDLYGDSEAQPPQKAMLPAKDSRRKLHEESNGEGGTELERKRKRANSSQQIESEQHVLDVSQHSRTDKSTPQKNRGDTIRKIGKQNQSSAQTQAKQSNQTGTNTKDSAVFSDGGNTVTSSRVKRGGGRRMVDREPSDEEAEDEDNEDDPDWNGGTGNEEEGSDDADGDEDDAAAPRKLTRKGKNLEKGRAIVQAVSQRRVGRESIQSQAKTSTKAFTTTRSTNAKSSKAPKRTSRTKESAFEDGWDEVSIEQERGRTKARSVAGGAGRPKARKGRHDDDDDAEEDEVIEIEAFPDADVIQNRDAVVGRIVKRDIVGSRRDMEDVDDEEDQTPRRGKGRTAVMQQTMAAVEEDSEEEVVATAPVKRRAPTNVGDKSKGRDQLPPWILPHWDLIIAHFLKKFGYKFIDPLDYKGPPPGKRFTKTLEDCITLVLPKRKYVCEQKNSDKIYTVAVSEYQNWKKGFDTRAKEATQSHVGRLGLKGKKAIQAWATEALSKNGFARWGKPDSVRPREAFQSPIVIASLANHIRKTQAAASPHDPFPFGALCLAQLAAVRGVQRFSTGTFIEQHDKEWSAAKYSDLVVKLRQGDGIMKVREKAKLQSTILDKVVQYINKDKKGGKLGAPKPEELIFDTVERSSSIPLPSDPDSDEQE